MSKHSKSSLRNDSGFVEIKSKFDAEFRRFAVERNGHYKIESFLEYLEKLHSLRGIPFTIMYTDNQGDLLPINNDDNFNLALNIVKPVLRILIQRKGVNYEECNGYGTAHERKQNSFIKILSSELCHMPRQRIAIGSPEDFHQVCAIIDVDIVPVTHRRVKLMKKNGSGKPLGFYIRDGLSVMVTRQGLKKAPGVFISRLIPGGLAEGTGLLAVNDEVIEVNGIEVCGKTLDQVTDMMVANSSNLIITVKPVNQQLTLASSGRHRQSSSSGHSRQSSKSCDSDLNTEDDDEVKDYLSKTSKGDHKNGSKNYHNENNDLPETSPFNEHISKSENGRFTENYDKVKFAACLEKNRNNDSQRSNGSDRQSGRRKDSGRQSSKNKGSDRQSGRSNGSDRQSGRNNISDRQSGRNNGSDRQSGRSNISDRQSGRGNISDRQSGRNNESDSQSSISNGSNRSDRSSGSDRQSIRSNGSDRQIGRSNGNGRQSDGSDRQIVRSNGSDRQSDGSNGSDRQISRSNESDTQSSRNNGSDGQCGRSNGCGRQKTCN